MDKLNPHNHTDIQAGFDDEVSVKILSEKKSRSDFALWKKAAKGEMSWANPFSSERGSTATTSLFYIDRLREARLAY